MRVRPVLHPTAELRGAAPRGDGMWVSVWMAGDVVCVTIGELPGDAATGKRSSVHTDEHAAEAAARDRLAELADAYLGDHAPPRDEVGVSPGRWVSAAAPPMPVVLTEGPV